MSCRDRLNDLEELIYSMGPERVNVPSKMEQLSFLTSEICPSTVLGSLVRHFRWRSEWVLTSVYTLTNLYISSLILFSMDYIWKQSPIFYWHSLYGTSYVLMTLGIHEYVDIGRPQTHSSIPWAIVDGRHSGLRPPLTSLKTCSQQMIGELTDGKTQPKS